MDSRLAARAWLLRDLRRVEWRRLLLAIAVLAAWARILAPLPVQAAAGGGDPILCVQSDARSGTADGGVAVAHADRACPLCRLADIPAGLVPPAPSLRLAAAHDISAPTIPAAARYFPASPPHPPARAPPAIATIR